MWRKKSENEALAENILKYFHYEISLNSKQMNLERNLDIVTGRNFCFDLVAGFSESEKVSSVRGWGCTYFVLLG